MTDEQLTADVREVVKQYAGISADADVIAADADLYASGMTSFASVEVMLGLEEKFAIEFPPDLVKRGTFLSISAIADAVAEIRSRT
jgi:acyl carrier protein